MGKWNFEKCKEIALGCKTKKEFYELSCSCYTASKRHGWFSEITKHMHPLCMPKNYWSFERCEKEALKYQTKRDFAKNSVSAYGIAKRKNFFYDITKHMIPLGNQKMRTVYSFEFPDNCVYVGLTYDIDKRNKEHQTNKKSSVCEHITKTGLTPVLVNLIDEYINLNEAKKLEMFWIKKYLEDKWILLNKTTGGELGCSKLYWTYEMCEIEAKNYDMISNFRKFSSSAYGSAKRNKWLNEISTHMYIKQKPKGYWSFERCQFEALKYNKKIDFKTKSKHAYYAARSKGWVNTLCTHMF